MIFSGAGGRQGDNARQKTDYTNQKYSSPDQTFWAPVFGYFFTLLVEDKTKKRTNTRLIETVRRRGTSTCYMLSGVDSVLGAAVNILQNRSVDIEVEVTAEGFPDQMDKP